MSTSTSSASSKLRQACLDLLEAEYQLEQRRHHQQQEDYTSASDVSSEWNRYAGRLRRVGGYALIALIVSVVMKITNMGGVIRDVAAVVLLITGLPAAYYLLRLLMTLPMRAKAASDERRMAKKWSSFDKAEASCNKQRQRLAASLPASEGKRFVHIPALGAKPVYTGYQTARLRLGGGVNFTERNGRNYVEGLTDMQPCSAKQILEFIKDAGLVGFHFDRAYLRNHPEETYFVGSVLSFTHKAALKSHTTRYNQIDVNATMANFDSAFERAERRASASGHTHQEDYDAGRMSFGDYRVMEDFKEREMEREREDLKRRNDQNTRTVFYYDEVTQDVYTAGLIVTTDSKRLVYAGYYEAGQDVMRFAYRLPKYERTSSGGGLSEETANALQGELLSFEEPQGFQGVDQRSVMDFVLQRFKKNIASFNPLQKQPANMEDNDFRFWVELRYLYSRGRQ